MLKRIAKDDKIAFQILYERYHHALYRRIFHLLPSAEETDDILQETFISLWEHRTKLDTERPIGGWLFTISFNRLLNHLKKKGRERARVQVIAVLAGESDSTNTDVTESKLAILDAAVRQLPPKKRLAFELCKIEGKTYEKAATEMGVSRHTVKEYLREAMNFLREYVRQHPSYDATLLSLLLLKIFLK